MFTVNISFAVIQQMLLQCHVMVMVIDKIKIIYMYTKWIGKLYKMINCLPCNWSIKRAAQNCIIFFKFLAIRLYYVYHFKAFDNIQIMQKSLRSPGDSIGMMPNISKYYVDFTILTWDLYKVINTIFKTVKSQLRIYVFWRHKFIKEIYLL